MRNVHRRKTRRVSALTCDGEPTLRFFLCCSCLKAQTTNISKERLQLIGLQMFCICWIFVFTNIKSVSEDVNRKGNCWTKRLQRTDKLFMNTTVLVIFHIELWSTSFVILVLKTRGYIYLCWILWNIGLDKFVMIGDLFIDCLYRFSSRG